MKKHLLGLFQALVLVTLTSCGGGSEPDPCLTSDDYKAGQAQADKDNLDAQVKGAADGMLAALNLTPEQGTTDGYADGYNDSGRGYPYAYNLAYNAADAYPAGYSWGYSHPLTPFTDAALGRQAGDTAGYNDGQRDGRNAGENDGYNDGYPVGYDDGYWDGSFNCPPPPPPPGGCDPAIDPFCGDPGGDPGGCDPAVEICGGGECDPAVDPFCDFSRAQKLAAGKRVKKQTDATPPPPAEPPPPAKSECFVKGYGSRLDNNAYNTAFKKSFDTVKLTNTAYMTTYNAAYPIGVSDGYAAGIIDGKNQGYAKGVVDGQQAVSDDIYLAAYNAAYDAAYPSAYSQGYTIGYNSSSGFDEGYSDGYDAGYSDGQYYNCSFSANKLAVKRGSFADPLARLVGGSKAFVTKGTKAPNAIVTNEFKKIVNRRARNTDAIKYSLPLRISGETMMSKIKESRASLKKGSHIRAKANKAVRGVIKTN